MNHRENFLRAIRFETPDRIPATFHINEASWQHYDQEALKDLMEGHPLLFPGYARPAGPIVPRFAPEARRDSPFLDQWGCLWETTEDGLVGTISRHPLESWDDFVSYVSPDPDRTNGMGPVDWAQIAARTKRAKQEGQLIRGGLPHGHTFLRLQYICGYANLLYAMADEDPRLIKLIDMVSEFNYGLVQHWLALDPDVMCYPEDLGMQVGPLVSPDLFRRYIKPVFRRMMQPARDAGTIVHMHSDGDIKSLVDDLVDGGVEVVNLQDLVNGIDWIAEKFAGRVCVDLDIDRQSITVFGTPAQIDALIREEVEKIGSSQGGLILTFGLYPGTPIENVKAVMDAMERYSTHFA